MENGNYLKIVANTQAADNPLQSAEKNNEEEKTMNKRMVLGYTRKDGKFVCAVQRNSQKSILTELNIWVSRETAEAIIHRGMWNNIVFPKERHMLANCKRDTLSKDSQYCLELLGDVFLMRDRDFDIAGSDLFTGNSFTIENNSFVFNSIEDVKAQDISALYECTEKGKWISRPLHLQETLGVVSE